MFYAGKATKCYSFQKELKREYTFLKHLFSVFRYQKNANGVDFFKDLKDFGQAYVMAKLKINLKIKSKEFIVIF